MRRPLIESSHLPARTKPLQETARRSFGMTEILAVGSVFTSINETPISPGATAMSDCFGARSSCELDVPELGHGAARFVEGVVVFFGKFHERGRGDYHAESGSHDNG